MFRANNFGASVLGVRTEKLGLLERARIANKIQGFRIPDHLEAVEK